MRGGVFILLLGSLVTLVKLAEYQTAGVETT